MATEKMIEALDAMISRGCRTNFVFVPGGEDSYSEFTFELFAASGPKIAELTVVCGEVVSAQYHPMLSAYTREFCESVAKHYADQMIIAFA